MERDLPDGRGRPRRTRVPAALLKGRNHQLSLRRWQRFLASPDGGPHGPDLDRVRFKLKLLAWLAETERGDRGELHLNGHEEMLWRHVESDGGDCLGAACANWQDNRCFMVAARRTAEAASIVITNHALLLADAAAGGQALGEPRRAGHRRGPPPRERRHRAARGQPARRRRHGRPRPARPRRGRAGRRPGGGAGGGHPALRRRQGADRRGARRRPQRQRLGRPLGRGARRPRARRAGALRGASRSNGGGRPRRGCATPRSRGSFQAQLLPQPERADEERLLAAAALEELAAAVERVVLRPVPATSPGWRCAPSRASSTRRR